MSVRPLQLVSRQVYRAYLDAGIRSPGKLFDEILGHTDYCIRNPGQALGSDFGAGFLDPIPTMHDCWTRCQQCMIAGSCFESPQPLDAIQPEGLRSGAHNPRPLDAIPPEGMRSDAHNPRLLDAIPPEGLHFGRIERGLYRGHVECYVENLERTLKANTIIETGTFDVGGLKWKLALSRGFPNSCEREMITVYLFSCNLQAIFADVELSVRSKQESRSYCLEGLKSKGAGPFHCIDKCDIPFNQLAQLQEKCSTGSGLLVTVDLKNITTDRACVDRNDIRTVRLEIVTDQSINKVCNENHNCAVVPSERQQNSDVCSGSLVRLWAGYWPDYRHWLCVRCKDETLVLVKCLNESALHEIFEDISDQVDGGHLWVTVFREEKKSSEPFLPIDDDTILIFCMLSEPGFMDLSYCGHHIVPKTMSFHELSRQVAQDVAGIPICEKFNIYLKTGASYRKVNGEQATLEEGGVLSGSIFIVERLRECGEQACFSTDRPTFFTSDVSSEGFGQNCNLTHEPASRSEINGQGFVVHGDNGLRRRRSMASLNTGRMTQETASRSEINGPAFVVHGNNGLRRCRSTASLNTRQSGTSVFTGQSSMEGSNRSADAVERQKTEISKTANMARMSVEVNSSSLGPIQLILPSYATHVQVTYGVEGVLNKENAETDSERLEGGQQMKKSRSFVLNISRAPNGEGTVDLPQPSKIFEEPSCVNELSDRCHHMHTDQPYELTGFFDNQIDTSVAHKVMKHQNGSTSDFGTLEHAFINALDRDILSYRLQDIPDSENAVMIFGMSDVASGGSNALQAGGPQQNTNNDSLEGERQSIREIERLMRRAFAHRLGINFGFLHKLWKIAC